MQDASALELSTALAAVDVGDVLQRDVAFLDSFGLVDYSLLTLKHPPTAATAATAGSSVMAFTEYGAALRTKFGFEASLALINICSTLDNSLGPTLLGLTLLRPTLLRPTLLT